MRHTFADGSPGYTPGINEARFKTSSWLSLQLSVGNAHVKLPPGLIEPAAS
jgi:hypothetical protein